MPWNDTKTTRGCQCLGHTCCANTPKHRRNKRTSKTTNGHRSRAAGLTVGFEFKSTSRTRRKTTLRFFGVAWLCMCGCTHNLWQQRAPNADIISRIGKPPCQSYSARHTWFCYRPYLHMTNEVVAVILKRMDDDCGFARAVTRRIWKNKHPECFEHLVPSRVHNHILGVHRV